jgi:transcriptional regulator with XRE-family HTH domain
MEDEIKEVFSKNFKLAMFELDLSNKDASESMGGIAPQTITAYRSGKKMPPVRYIVMFAGCYNVSIDWLLRDIGEMCLPTEDGRRKEEDQQQEISKLVRDLRSDYNKIIEKIGGV